MTTETAAWVVMVIWPTSTAGTGMVVVTATAPGVTATEVKIIAYIPNDTMNVGSRAKFRARN